MTRLLNTLFILAGTLLLSIPLYAKLPADSLLDKYVKGLHAAIEQKVEANKTAARKDYLLIYEDDPKFRTDFVNDGRDFWFAENSIEETKLRALVNTVQGQTGGEPLYVVLGSIYNYANLDDIDQHITWSAKDKYKPAEAEDIRNDDIRKRILPAVGNKKGTAGSPHSVLYVISYFTIDNEGYKVSHRSFYESSYSLKENGFVVRATDKVETSNTPETDLKNKRVSYLESTIKAVSASMGQFSEEMKKVNDLFAQLPEGSLGKKFYNDYNGVCKDQLVLKKLALLINEIGLDAYNAYLGDKSEADSYDAVVFRAFYNNLKNFYDTYKKVSQKITEVKTAGKLASTLEMLTSSELGALKYPERIQGIRLLNQLVNLNDDSWWNKLNGTPLWRHQNNPRVVPGSEELMINLISSTPDNQISLLKDDLMGKDGSYSLLLDIFKKTDDEPVGNNNYTKLIQELAVIIVRNATAEDLDNLYAKNRFYTWNNGSLRTIIDDESNPQVNSQYNNVTFPAAKYSYFVYKPTFPERYKITLEKSGAVPLVDYDLLGRAIPRVCTTGCNKDLLLRISQGDQKLDPFDLIAIIPEQNINFNTGLSIEKSQVALVPAFFLQWYIDKKDNKEIKSNINYTLAAVSILAGGAGILTAATWGARIMIAAETFFAVTATASAEYPAFDNFMRNNLGNVGYSIFKGVEFGVNLFATLKGAASIGKGAYNAAQRLSDSFLDLMKNRPDVLAMMQTAHPDRYAKLVAWFKNLGKDITAFTKSEGSYAAFLEKGKINFKYDVPGPGGERAAHFVDNSGNIFSEGGSSLLQTPVTAGGGGGATAVVIETQKLSATAQYSKGLLAELNAKYGAIDEGIATFVKVTEPTPNKLGLLLSAVASKTVATVKVLTNTEGTGKAVTVETETETYLVYAEGAAKVDLEEYVERLKKCDLCTDEPLICLLEKRATCKEKSMALAKLCAQLPASQLKPVCTRLNALQLSDLNAFLTDVVVDKPSVHCRIPYNYVARNVRSLTPGLIDSWDRYQEAGRNCVRVSLDHLRKMESAWNNKRLHEAPYSFTWDDFVAIAKAGGSANQYAEKYDNTVFDNLQSFCRLQATFVNIDKLKEKLQQENSGAALEGINFTIKYMGSHTSEFNGQILHFENGGLSDDRDIDVTGVIPPLLTIFYEFKSVEQLEEGKDATEEKPARLGFADQFTKDLRNADIVDQITWIFDKDKIVTDADLLTQVLNRLKSDRSMKIINTLDDAKKHHYFGWDPSVGGDLTNAQVEAFIRRNFTKIFRRG